MRVALVVLFRTRHPAPPLGVGYIAAVLKKNGHDVEIIDFNLTRTEEDFKKELKRIDPGVVGFSVPTTVYPDALEAARVTRSVVPGALVVFGGPHPSVSPKEVMSNKEVDAIVLGEGEYTFLDIVNTVEKGNPLKGVKGIWYNDKGKTVMNGPREFIQNLDELPYPDRDLMHIEWYLSQPPIAPFLMPYGSVNAHRGCPFNCLYCQPTSKKMFGLKVRKRDPAKMVEESLEIANKYKLKMLNFSADTFTAIKPWTMEFCKQYSRNGPAVPFWINGRVGTIDREMAKALKKAGCHFISFGIESGNQKILEFLRRGMTVQQIKDTFKTVSDVGIITGGNIMLGHPGETRETLWDSYQILKDTNPDYIGGPYITTPLIGTDLYDYVMHHDMMMFDGDYSKMSRFGIGSMKLKNFTHEELMDAREHFIKMLFRMKIRLLLTRPHLRRSVMKRAANLIANYPKAYDNVRKAYSGMGMSKQKHLRTKLLEMFIKGV